MSNTPRRADAHAGQAAPAPAPAARPATPSRPTGDTATATTGTVPTTGTTRSSATRARGTASTPTILRRLTVASVLACSLNGAAAYTLVQSEAPRVQAVAQEQDAALQAIGSDLAGLPQAARQARGDDAAVSAYHRSVETVSGRVTTAAVRSAAGPDAFAADAARFETLSAASTGYVVALERARASSGAAATAAYDQAETVRTSRVDPALAALREANTARSDEADVATLGTIGGLGVTTLAVLGTLIGGAFWLARRTKRIVNPALTVATLAAIGTSAYAFSALSTAVASGGPFTGPAVLLGGLTSAGLSWFGFEQRRGEYR